MRKLNALLIVNGFLKTEKFNELAELFLDASKRLNISLWVLSNSEIVVSDSDLSQNNINTDEIDFVLFWDKDVLLAAWFEQLGIPVYNSAKAISLCDDKRKTYLCLLKEGIDMPDTVVAPMTFRGIGFTDFTFLNQIENKLGYPMVVKEAYGSFGAQVYLARNREELEKTIKNCSSEEILFQQYIRESEGRDIRLQVVGERVVAAMYRYSDDDFRANVSAGGHMRAYLPSKKECALAIKAARAVGADFAGVDLLFGKNGPLVCEVNSNAHFKNLMDCTGCDTAYEILSYIRLQTEPLQAWLVYDKEGAERNTDYIRLHKEIGKKMGIHFQFRLSDDIDGETEFEKTPDFAIVRTINPALSKKLEDAGIEIYNNAFVSEVCNHKGKTISYMTEHTSVPAVPTITYDNAKLTREFLLKHQNEVIKSVDGHGGAQVFRTEDNFEKIKSAIGEADFILQPFIEGPGKDVRFYIIGKEIIAAIERTSADGFHSNYSLGGDVKPWKVKKTERDYIREICEVLPFGMVGIDFILDKEGKLILNEIEDVVGARMLYKCCPDIHLLEKYFSFIIEKRLH